MIYEVKVPRLGVNEDKVKIVEWLVVENGEVSINQPICNVETSKALFEITAEQNGFLKIKTKTGEEVGIQDTIGFIVDPKNTPIPKKGSMPPNITAKAEISKQKLLVTRKAQELAQKFEVDIMRIKKKGLVKEKDIKDFIKIKKKSSTSKMKIAIYGASEGGLVALECAELSDKYSVAVFIDDDPNLEGRHKKGIKIIRDNNSKFLKELGIKGVFIAIANADFRLNLRDKAGKANLELVNLIHPDSFISPNATLGKGNIIKAGAVIDSNTRIGDCCIVDNNTTIAHSNLIEDGCHLAPGSTLGSSIYIGEKTIVGIGANISTNIKIGQGVIIGVGSSVIKDVPDNSIVEGVPGKIIGKRKL